MKSIYETTGKGYKTQGDYILEDGKHEAIISLLKKRQRKTHSNINAENNASSSIGVTMYTISIYFDEKTNRTIQSHINRVAEQTGNPYQDIKVWNSKA